MTFSLRRLAPLLLATASLPFAAHAAGDGAVRLEVLVDGRPLHEVAHDGTTYVEAARGREYSLRVTNLEPVRVAVAVSVDGRNVIDARRTTAGEARKWVLQPWQSIVLDGWQVSDSRARRFVFTTESRSYAEWLGDSSQAGVIEAIAFRERPPAWESSWRPGVVGGGFDADARSREEAGDGPSASASAGAAARAPESAAKNAPTRSLNALAETQSSHDAAATGIGEDVGHDVVRVEFRHESQPAGRARIRYGYRDELVELGVLPRPRPTPPWSRREQAHGFEPGPFCPSP